MSTELLWSKWGAIGQCETLNTKPLICMVYFLNVTEYFTTLTGKDDSRKEKIAWFADNGTEKTDIPTLDQGLTAHLTHAISAGQVKEMTTKPEVAARMRACGGGVLIGSSEPYQNRVHVNRAITVRGVIADARCEAAPIGPCRITVLTVEGQPSKDLPIKVQGEVEIVSVLR